MHVDRDLLAVVVHLFVQRHLHVKFAVRGTSGLVTKTIFFDFFTNITVSLNYYLDADEDL